MNTFQSLMCFALVATSTANSGYNYQQPRPIVNQVFHPSAPFVNSAAAALAPPSTSHYIPPPNVVTVSPDQYSQPQIVASAQFINQPPQYFPPFQQPPLHTPAGHVVSTPPYSGQQQRQTIISSNVYVHAAPEETEEIFADQDEEAAPLRKNYRVIFVKAPTHNLRLNMNSFKQAQAANEEKTVIYVLSKKPDVASFQSQLSSIQTEPKTHKPEVYFVKYRTEAEANRAQQEIQAQYDTLGGSTIISDEGFAPVNSVIGDGPIKIGSSGSLNVASSSGSYNFIQSASNSQQNFIQTADQGKRVSAPCVSFGTAASSSRYLPAKKK